MFGENLVLELWSKNLKVNHNVGFFKQEYLTNMLRYLAEFLNVARDPWEQQILVDCKMMKNGESALSQEWVELWS